MTTQEKFESIIYNMGVFENDAKAIIETAKPELAALLPSYKITWDRPASEYPEPFYNVAMITVKKVALKWIEENKPNAWFKAVFM